MRKTEIAVVPKLPGPNRDLGKRFVLTEWSAERAETWGIRMMLAFNRSAGEIPLELRGIGMEGVAILGINTFLRGNIQADEIVPLLNELLECVQIIRDPGKGPDYATQLVSPDDIEDVATRLWLRSEVLRLHTNFSPADALSALISAIQAKTKENSAST